MVGYYNWSVVLTYINLALGMCGIYLSIEENFPVALACMMAAGIMDMFDGRVARLVKRSEEEKRFGIQIDSLCDLLCFGIFPAIFVYMYGAQASGYVIILILYVLVALIRLAYFNLTEEARQQEKQEPSSDFQGLPVTTVAIFLPFLFVCEGIIGEIKAVYLVALLAMLGILFIVKIKVKKMGLKLFGICLILAILLVIKLFL